MGFIEDLRNKMLQVKLAEEQRELAAEKQRRSNEERKRVEAENLERFLKEQAELRRQELKQAQRVFRDTGLSDILQQMRDLVKDSLLTVNNYQPGSYRSQEDVARLGHSRVDAYFLSGKREIGRNERSVWTSYTYSNKDSVVSITYSNNKFQVGVRHDRTIEFSGREKRSINIDPLRQYKQYKDLIEGELEYVFNNPEIYNTVNETVKYRSYSRPVDPGGGSP